MREAGITYNSKLSKQYNMQVVNNLTEQDAAHVLEHMGLEPSLGSMLTIKAIAVKESTLKE